MARASFPTDGTKSRATLADVAAAAGVSVTTVSYALNGKGSIPEATRAAVRQAANDLGYESDYFAQNIKASYRDVIALCATIDLGISTLMLWEVQHRLDEKGYAVEMHPTPVCVSDFEAKQVAMLRSVRRQKPRAIISEVACMSEASLQELRLFCDKGGLLVGYGNGTVPDIDCDCVIYDEEDSAYQAARHLIKQGHRDIGLCIHHDEVVEAHPHVAGWTRAMQEFGVPINSDWMWGKCCYEDGGAELGQAFMALAPEKRPTAICIINDVMTASFVNFLTRAGVRVPHDVSIIGHDNTPAARHCVVPLTTFSHSVTTMTGHLMELLMSRLEGRYSGPSRRIMVQGELICRDSVRKMETASRPHHDAVMPYQPHNIQKVTV
jgi:DNA-binding LacI/PurR family transcriptional regulator